VKDSSEDIPPNCWYIIIRMHGVTTQETTTYTQTVIKTSNPVYSYAFITAKETALSHQT
jgi:hypothetical protein